MLDESKTSGACQVYEVRLEDYLNGATDAELQGHIDGCAACRIAIENARLAGTWLRRSWTPVGEPQSAFLGNVMTRIWEEKSRVEAAAAFWNPLELLASRMALTAAVLLLVLSAYLAGAASHPAVVLPTRSELSATDFPQPPGDPVSNEEVLQSLAEVSNGR
jgi:hypothetical protein